MDFVGRLVETPRGPECRAQRLQNPEEVVFVCRGSQLSNQNTWLSSVIGTSAPAGTGTVRARTSSAARKSAEEARLWEGFFAAPPPLHRVFVLRSAIIIIKYT